MLLVNRVWSYSDMLTEDDEKMVAFGIGGICNSCIGELNFNEILSKKILFRDKLPFQVLITFFGAIILMTRPRNNIR